MAYWNSVVFLCMAITSYEDVLAKTMDVLEGSGIFVVKFNIETDDLFLTDHRVAVEVTLGLPIDLIIHFA